MKLIQNSVYMRIFDHLTPPGFKVKRFAASRMAVELKRLDSWAVAMVVYIKRHCIVYVKLLRAGPKQFHTIGNNA